MKDLKDSACQLVNEAMSEVLARYTETEINEHISNIEKILEMFSTEFDLIRDVLDPHFVFTLEQMLENLEFTKSDLEQQL